MDQVRLFELRAQLFGRVKEMTQIRSALADPAGRTELIYIVGRGGIGKTRLLEEAVKEEARWHGRPVLSSGIIDLFHAEYDSAEGIQRAIVDGLDPGHKLTEFDAHRKVQGELDMRLAAGVRGANLQELRLGLTVSFVAGYQALAGRNRIELCFDTMELLQHENDRIQAPGQPSVDNAGARNWLLENLPRLPNTVVLLAGRPSAPLRDQLFAACEGRDDCSAVPFTLAGLSLDETLAYINWLGDLEPRIGDLSPEMRHSIWASTRGHPIRLSLVTDLVLNGSNAEELVQHLEDAASSAEKEAAAAGRNLAEEEAGNTPAELAIDRLLMNELLALPSPTSKMLHYLALARKGLDAELLHYLEPEWSIEVCEERLKWMRSFTFVKNRPPGNLLFLQDEIYGLFDRMVLRQHYEYGQTYERLASHFKKALDNRPVVRYVPAIPMINAEEMEKRRKLKVARLYYLLQADPWRGFWSCFVPYDEEAVGADDRDLDVRLRDELQRFRASTERDRWVANRLPAGIVERDAAVRSIRRAIEGDDCTAAKYIAERIAASDDEALQSDDPLYRGALLTSTAEALFYTSSASDEAILKKLAEAVAILRDWEPDSEDDPRTWWRARVLGRAYNDRGYIHSQAGRNRAAIAELRSAVHYFRQADIRDEMANALNNIGFVYARWGQSVMAEAALEDAMDLRIELGLEAPLSLSLNTQGLAFTADGFPLRGGRRCEQALKIAQRLGLRREEVLALIGLGFSRRWQAEQWKIGSYTKERALELFGESEQYLLKAEKARGDEEEEEPFRLWEILSEIGSAYTDWAWLLKSLGREAKEQGKDAEAEQWEVEAQKKYDQAEDYLWRSVAVAEKYGFDLQAVDSYDDLSQVFSDRGGHDQEAEQCLDRIRNKIPPEYDLKRGGFSKLTDEVEGWWLALGKLHLGYGVRLMKKAMAEAEEAEKDKQLYEAAGHYQRAVAYLEQYSPVAHKLEDTLLSMHRKLKKVRQGPLREIRNQMTEFGKEYGVELRRPIEMLDTLLGLQP